MARQTHRIILSLVVGLVTSIGLLGTAHAQEGPLPEAPTHTRPPLTNPACTSWGADRVDCFIVGNNGLMYHTWSDQASSGDVRDFSPWFEEPGVPQAGFDPDAGIGVTSWAPDRLDIMAINGDGFVVHRYYDFGAWQPAEWEMLGAPGAAEVTEIGCSSWGVNRIDCFTRGTDRHVYQIAWDGFGWHWVDMGPLPTGTSVDSPYFGIASAGYQSTLLYQVVIAVDGNVYHSKWDGATWSGWVNGGKPPTPDNLMTVTCQAGVIYVMDCVFLDVRGRVWHRSYYEGQGSWLSWHNLGPVSPGGNAYYAAGLGYSKVIGDYGAMVVMAYGIDGQIYLGFGRGSTSTFDWYGWDSLGRPRDQRQFLPMISR